MVVPMCDELRKVDDYFYVDRDGNAYFSVDNFLRINNFPNDLSFRRVVIQELEAIFAGVRILEEWN